MLLLLHLLLVLGGTPDTVSGEKATTLITLSDYDIYTPAEMAVMDNGHLVVGDSDVGRLLYFDTNGQLIREVGHKGQGPGEFGEVSLVDWYPREKVVRIFDFVNRRFSRYTQEGQLLNEVVLKKEMIFDFSFISEDVFITARDIGGHFQGRPYLSHINLASGEEVKLWERPLAMKRDVTGIEGKLMVLTDWDPKLIFGVGSDFIAAIWTEDDQVQILDFQGKLIGEAIPVQFPRLRVTDEDVDKKMEEYPAEFRAQLKANVVRDEYWPTLTKIIVDQKDRIWLFGPKNRQGQHPFHIVGKKGKRLGSGGVPALPKIAGDVIYYQEEVEDSLYIKKRNIKL